MQNMLALSLRITQALYISQTGFFICSKKKKKKKKSKQASKQAKSTQNSYCLIMTKQIQIYYLSEIKFAYYI